MLNDKSHIAYERAARLKSLRLMANLKRDEFAKLLDVSPTTVSYWENVTHAGLTEDGARKTVQAVEQLEIICTVHWLMFGTGERPYKKGQAKNDVPAIMANIEAPFEQEIALFQTMKDTVVMPIIDDAMSPLFLKHDNVGGIWHNLATITVNERATVIVEFNNQLLVRKIRAIGLNKYDLYATCLDPDSTTPYEIKGISLTRVAPIIRLWRNG
jgi:transcriptional regulator with XRE-family HTH domain